MFPDKNFPKYNNKLGVIEKWKWCFETMLISIYSIFLRTYAKLSEGAARRSSVKKMFLKVSQNSQGNTCVGVSFSTLLKNTQNTFVSCF